MLQDAPRVPRILVVDDEEVNCELLEGLLESFGYETVTAENGKVALEKLDESIDLVLLDVMMPVMNGFEVARHIRVHETLSQLPIVMATALSSKADRLQAVEAGANDFVTKPIDRMELRVRLASLLKMKAAQDEAKFRQDELRRKNEALEADLNLAREIQQAFFPPRFSTFPSRGVLEQQSLRFDCRCFPTSTLGGDFADIVPISPTQVGLIVCDVMGHGIRSALVTAILRGLVEELSHVAATPGEFLTQLNISLMAVLSRAKAPLFASAFFVVADIESREMSFANAGHPRPFLVKRNASTIEELSANDCDCGPALGVCEEFEYPTCSCAFESGDFVAIFTDGLFEVQDEQEEFGEERLRQALLRRSKQPMTQIFDEVLAEVQEFASGHVFDDDVCLVGMEATIEIEK